MKKYKGFVEIWILWIGQKNTQQNALVFYRILEQKLKEKYTCEELIDTIRAMDMLIAPGEGYIPTYTRTDITDALHDAFGFRTDYQITSQKNMRKIMNQTKKK